MAGTAVGPCRHVDLTHRGLPAHIAHIGGAGVEGIPLKKGQEEIVHGVAEDFLFLRCLFGISGIIGAAGAGSGVAAGIGLGQGVGKGQLLRRVRGNAYLLEVLLQQPLQGVVGDGVCQAVDKLAVKSSLGHEGRALGDLIHPLLQLHRLRHPVGAHHVQHAGIGLHHVGAEAAAIGDGVVDTGLVAHVLPQELYADVHQLHRVQGAAASFRRAGGVGRHAVELILHLDAGIGGAGDHLVAIVWMPGQRGIQLPPKLLPGHKGLGGAALLAGAAVEDHRAAFARLLQPGLHAKGSSHGARAQQVVAAAMTAAAGSQRFPLRHPGFLGKTGEGVILRQKADDRPTGAKGGRESRGNAAEAPLHPEALVFQHVTVQRGGALFLEGKLRKAPNLPGHLFDQIFFLFHRRQGDVFFVVHGDMTPFIRGQGLDPEASPVMPAKKEWKERRSPHSKGFVTEPC